MTIAKRRALGIGEEPVEEKTGGEWRRYGGLEMRKRRLRRSRRTTKTSEEVSGSFRGSRILPSSIGMPFRSRGRLWEFCYSGDEGATKCGGAAQAAVRLPRRILHTTPITEQDARICWDVIGDLGCRLSSQMDPEAVVDLFSWLMFLLKELRFAR